MRSRCMSRMGSVHNVIYVATEGDSVYAFDADSNTGTNAGLLWHASVIDTAHGAAAGATTMNSSTPLGCTDLVPQVGITSTPVIDPSTGTMYLEAKSEENGAFIHRLHALDITTGAEKAPGPVVITGTVSSAEPARVAVVEWGSLPLLCLALRRLAVSRMVVRL